jgi:hypothetical protein
MYLEDGYDVMIFEDTIIIVGEQDAGVSMFSSGLGGKDFYVVTVDRAGQEIWAKNYEEPLQILRVWFSDSGTDTFLLQVTQLHRTLTSKIL